MNGDDPRRELEQQGYTLARSLRHDNLVPFILNNLFVKNPVTISFLLYNIISLCIFIFLFMAEWNRGTSWMAISWRCLVGLGLTLLLVVPHELLHGIAYKITGAPSVTFHANWKQYYFMASAHHFITHPVAFIFIATLPFFVISLVFLWAAFSFYGPWAPSLALIQLVHATMCAGDFGMLSYNFTHRSRKPAMIDDMTEGETYIYFRPERSR
jgi:hypothetical protein